MHPPRHPLPVGLLGATGMVGQHFVSLLRDHPWFRLTWLGASERSAGRSYREAVRWVVGGKVPDEVAELPVHLAEPSSRCPRLVFSAMDARAAGEVERSFARAGHTVVSNSRNHRMDPDVPLVIPEVNPEHLGLIDVQRRSRSPSVELGPSGRSGEGISVAGRGWSGAIVTNPNCSTITLALALAPLRHFDIRQVSVATLQAVSGAGYPGVPSVDVLGNVIPFIGGEEEKMAAETLKILGGMSGEGQVTPLGAVVSAHCNRVPVLDGHLVCASVELGARPSPEDVRDAMASFRGRPQELSLPTAPRHPVHLTEAFDGPQPRRDVHAEGGMAIVVGRVRACTLFSVKFVALGHNTVRGAAGASVLNAELMLAEGWIEP